MRKYLLFLLFISFYCTTYSQQIRVYGRMTDKGKPLPAVLITVYEDGVFYKKLLTGRKGHFHFSVEDKNYLILFYKPGYEPDAFILRNKMEHDVQMYPVNQEMIRSKESNDSTLAKSTLLTQLKSEVVKSYLTYVYKYERGRNDADSSSGKTRHLLVQRAIDERERFKNYKRDVTKRTVNNEEKQATTTIIGNDTYLMLVSAKGDKQYFKNDKPVTEVTYLFETSRRYEGVLNNTKDVKRFEKYNPQHHVKSK